MFNWIKGLLAGFGVVGMFVFITLVIFAGGICLHYDINWIQGFMHHNISSGVAFWIICLALGFFVGGISVPLALILFILKFFL